MTYDEIRDEVVNELKSKGIVLSFEDGVEDSVGVADAGRTLKQRYVNTMVDVAMARIDQHEHYAELGRSLEKITQLLADHKIEITIKELA